MIPVNSKTGESQLEARYTRIITSEVRKPNYSLKRLYSKPTYKQTRQERSQTTDKLRNRQTKPQGKYKEMKEDNTDKG